MRTGSELIQATRPFAQERRALSWWHVVSTGLLLLAALAGTVWNFHLAGRVACSVLSGLLMLRFFVIYHDQQHHAILNGSRLAEGLMRLFGLYVLSASSVWRSSHNHHHNHNSKLRGSHIGSFPIMTREQFLKSPRRKQVKYLFMRHPVTILLGYPVMFLFGMSLYPFINQPRRHVDCLVSFILHVAIGVTLWWQLGWVGLVLTQTVPHFIANVIGTYLFYAQHNFPGVSFADNAGWTYEKAALESSSFLRTGPLMRWFTANIGYHHIHHLNSRIPFYRLPEAMQALPELREPRTTSLHPRDVLRCLRLKVWDVDRQEMVPLG